MVGRSTSNHWDRAGLNGVGEDLPWTDSGQLVDIAHNQQGRFI
jgi:hypothetical protein